MIISVRHTLRCDECEEATVTVDYPPEAKNYGWTVYSNGTGSVHYCPACAPTKKERMEKEDPSRIK